MKRRLFLQGSVAGGVIGAGILPLKQVLAEWPQAQMDATDIAGALGASGSGEASDKIVFTAPETAENGAVVPYEIDASALEGVTNISLTVDSNNKPLVASFDIKEGAIPFVAVRVKMAKSGKATAVVTAGDKTYHSQRDVKVTAGGCA